MTRSGIFGWSYPPGCTQAMVDEAVGANIPDPDDDPMYDDGPEFENHFYLDYYYAPGDRCYYVLYDGLDSTPSWSMWMVPNQEGGDDVSPSRLIRFLMEDALANGRTPYPNWFSGFDGLTNNENKLLVECCVALRNDSHE